MYLLLSAFVIALALVVIVVGVVPLLCCAVLIVVVGVVLLIRVLILVVVDVRDVIASKRSHRVVDVLNVDFPTCTCLWFGYDWQG